MVDIRVLSYNIHKGFNSSNSRFVLHRMKESIELVHADLVFLQEVHGHREWSGRRKRDWPRGAQFEFIADRLWPHYAYGKNAAYVSGHHGNAILSKYPISAWENVDVTTNRLEKRGMLHAEIEIPRHAHPLHVICIHLGLLQTERETQIRRLCDRIRSVVPKEAPLIVAGDFNDWWQKATPVLRRELGLEEIFMALTGSHARTYPCWLPALHLDRIYYRSLQATRATALSSGIWGKLSDHAAVYGAFRF
jgi:endonuclease/exonuclease/phosphatase family metal-dependent hydrolase